jgi:large subunit ribosomal protein L5
MARLKERYKNDVLPALKKEFGYTNNMAVPRLEKIVLNVGVGREAQTNPKVFDQAALELATVRGLQAEDRNAGGGGGDSPRRTNV